jgi:hypothetical protein
MLSGVVASGKRGRWTLQTTFERTTEAASTHEFVGSPETRIPELKALVQQYHLAGCTAFCILPRTEALVLTVLAKDEGDALREQLPWPPAAALCRRFGPLESSERHFVAASRERIDQFRRAIEDAGMVLGGVQISLDGINQAQALAIQGPKAPGAWILSPEETPHARQARGQARTNLVLACLSAALVLFGLSFPYLVQAKPQLIAKANETVRLGPRLVPLLQAIPKGSSLNELQYDAAKAMVQVRGRSADHSTAAQLLAGLSKVVTVRALRNEKTSLTPGAEGVDFSGTVLLK